VKLNIRILEAIEQPLALQPKGEGGFWLPVPSNQSFQRHRVVRVRLNLCIIGRAEKRQQFLDTVELFNWRKHNAYIRVRRN